MLIHARVLVMLLAPHGFEICAHAFGRVSLISQDIASSDCRELGKIEQTLIVLHRPRHAKRVDWIFKRLVAKCVHGDLFDRVDKLWFFDGVDVRRKRHDCFKLHLCPP